MRKTFHSSSSRLLPALLVIATLTACGKHEENSAASAPPPSPSTEQSAAAQAQEDAASTAKCEGNPLTKAMPPQTTIDGLPFRLWSCTFNSVRAVYGKEGGKQVDISITDTRSPDIDKQPAMQDFYHRTFDTQRSMTQFSVQMLVSTIDAAKSHPDTLNTVGGPDYAPIAVPSPTGDPMLIHVGAQTDITPVEVVALFKDRHVLTMQASDKDGAITSLTGPKAQALFQPFIQQIHPELLP
jgi:hypothetical protein